MNHADGSYEQAWTKGDGSHGHANWNAATGQSTGDVTQVGVGYSYTYDNTTLGAGVTESKVTYTYTDGSTYSTDTVSLADGSYAQTWSSGNGMTGVTSFDAAGHLVAGNASDDMLQGGAGSDVLVGGAGNDTYQLTPGAGSDIILDNDGAKGNTDVAQFGAGINADQLWFRHVGNNLEVSIIGTSDSFTIGNWYVGSQYRVERFQIGDGRQLLDSQVQSLVEAMAAFAPPAAGQTTLPDNYAAALNPVIAANWQPESASA